MKKLFTILTLSLFTSFTWAQKSTPYLTKTFSASSIQNVGVKTSGGGIYVFGNNESKARVEVYIKGNNNKVLSRTEIEDRLEDYDFEVSLDGRTLVCIAEKESGMSWGNGLSITFKIYVPVEINTDLSTSGGGINLRNLSGNLKFRTSGGGLDLQDLNGYIKGSTSGGGISVKNCRKSIKLSTSGGGIEASECVGDIKLTTSGGGIALEKMNGNMEVSTSGGGISANYISGDLVATTSGGGISLNHIMANVSAKTSAGSIDANIDETEDFLELSTSSGNITIDVPNNEGYDVSLSGKKVGVSGIGNFTGTKDIRRMNGTVNGGGMEITARASSGRVMLK